MTRSIVNLPADIFWLIQKYVEQKEAAVLLQVCRQFNEAFEGRAWVQVPQKLLKNNALHVQDLLLKHGKHVRILHTDHALHLVVPLPFWPMVFSNVRHIVVGSPRETASYGLPAAELLSRQRLSQFQALQFIDVDISNLTSDDIWTEFANAANSVVNLMSVTFTGQVTDAVFASMNELWKIVDDEVVILLNMTLSKPQLMDNPPLFDGVALVGLNIEKSYYESACTHLINDYVFTNTSLPNKEYSFFPLLEQLSLCLGQSLDAAEEDTYVPTPDMMPRLREVTISTNQCSQADCSSMDDSVSKMFAPSWPSLQVLNLQGIGDSAFHGLLGSIPNVYKLDVSFISTGGYLDMYKILDSLPRLTSLRITAAEIVSAVYPREFLTNLNNDISVRTGFMANSCLKTVAIDRFSTMSGLVMAILFGLPCIQTLELNGAMSNLVDICCMLSGLKSQAKRVSISSFPLQVHPSIMTCIREVCSDSASVSAHN
ncbi:hypothetical protein GQ42DRAFT_170034 [Ramicandelaber brevisporus]|nr:hypothetical protein GQ42DRAFT_170034 [Ramicandelaber brevisporus]